MIEEHIINLINNKNNSINDIFPLIRELHKSNIIDISAKTKNKNIILDKIILYHGNDDISDMIDRTEKVSKNGTRATLAMCFNYGGQEEIVRAAGRLIDKGITSSEVTLESFTEALDHPDIPPCDLIVRTSGEQRLSDFMLWRSAYSEFLFLDKLWPEMTKDDVTAILEEYSNRQRRFGG